MDWFIYDNGPRHIRVKHFSYIEIVHFAMCYTAVSSFLK